MSKTDQIPYSSMAEEAVIGSALISAEAAPALVDRLAPEDFFVGENQVIWRAIRDLVQGGHPIDPVTVLNKVGPDNVNPDTVSSLYTNTPSAANAEHYAGIVADRSARRQLLRATQEIAHHAPSDPLEQLIDSAQSQINAIGQSSNDGLEPLSDVMSAWVQRMDNREQGVRGEQTGLIDFDEKTTGLHPGQLVYIGARPAMGKTTLALNIAENIAGNKPVGIWTLEMSGPDLIDRLVASLSGVDLQSIRKADLSDAQWADLTRAQATVNELPIEINDSGSMSVPRIRAQARRMQAQKGLGAVFVDYLQLLESEGENRTREVGKASRQLKQLAQDLGVPVICMVQLNRSLEQRPNKRPVLSDLRESGEIEQDADIVAFIYRDEVYNEDTPDKGVAELDIAKQRQGPTGKIFLTAMLDRARFASMERSEAADLNERRRQKKSSFAEKKAAL